MRRWAAAVWWFSTLSVAQTAPVTGVDPRVAELLDELRRESPRAEQLAAALRATANLPAPALAPHLATIAASAAAVPETVLAMVVDQIATAAPFADATVRRQLDAVADAVESRTAATLGKQSETAAPLARATARLFARARVDASAPVEQLLQPIRDEWDYTRTAACEALAARGPAAAVAAPTLRDYLLRTEHPTGHTKFAGEYYLMTDTPELAAARALLAITPAGMDQFVAFAAIVRHADGAERRAAVMDLVRTAGAEDLPAAVQALAIAAADVEVRTVREVAVALAALLPKEPTARAALEALRRHADAPVRATVEAALRAAGSPSRREESRSRTGDAIAPGSPLFRAPGHAAATGGR